MNQNQTAVDIPQEVLDYLSEQRTLTLATASSAGVPRASTFLYVSDGPNLFFWTKPETITARHVEQNPLVSFAIDEYSPDLRQTKGVQGMGECNVLLDGEEIARVAALFGDKFPDLSPGTTMSISFFRITPTELELIDNSKASSQAPEGRFGAEFHRERTYSVFNDLPMMSSDTLSAILQTTKADAGEVIVRAGSPADKFFIVVDGEVEVLRDEGGTQIARLGPGHFFGEIAIMRDRPRSATVKATQPTILLSMERDTFRDLVAQSLGTTTEFDQVIRARMRALGEGG